MAQRYKSEIQKCKVFFHWMITFFKFTFSLHLRLRNCSTKSFSPKRLPTLNLRKFLPLIFPKIKFYSFQQFHQWIFPIILQALWKTMNISFPNIKNIFFQYFLSSYFYWFSFLQSWLYIWIKLVFSAFLLCLFVFISVLEN